MFWQWYQPRGENDNDEDDGEEWDEFCKPNQPIRFKAQELFILLLLR